MDDDLKHSSKAIQDFVRQKVKCSSMANSITIAESKWAPFHRLKTKPEIKHAKNKQEVNTAGEKTWWSFTRKETFYPFIQISDSPWLILKDFYTKKSFYLFKNNDYLFYNYLFCYFYFGYVTMPIGWNLNPWGSECSIKYRIKILVWYHY